MHPIEIREQNAYLLQEVKYLLFASQCLMRAATNENPPANIGSAKSHISQVVKRLEGIAMRLDGRESPTPSPAASSRPALPKTSREKQAHNKKGER